MWHQLSRCQSNSINFLIQKVKHYILKQNWPTYSVAYNLNNHPRAILTSHLLGQTVIGSGEHGPLNSTPSPWVGYLREVARSRGNNRIHLADAFCGTCRVNPPRIVPRLKLQKSLLTEEFAPLSQETESIKIGVILGAGDIDRRVPLGIWKQFIELALEALPGSRVWVIGGAGEREAALSLEQQLSSWCLNQVTNCCGRTSLSQLASLLTHMHWVVGSDTGPLHLGVACGARAIGWYFSRARVHETGPYGPGHYVWQYQMCPGPETRERGLKVNDNSPQCWPLHQTVGLMGGSPVDSQVGPWTLWTSHRDEYGMYYVHDDQPDEFVFRRNETWNRLTEAKKWDPVLGELLCLAN